MTFIADLGFLDQCGADRLHLLTRICEKGELIETKTVSYLKWSVGEGLELWTRIVNGIPDSAFHPFYAGRTSLVVAVMEKMERPDRSLSDGAFLCWTRPCAGEGWIAGQLPFVFDVPDYHCYGEMQLPGLATVQLTAFALSLVGYETEEDYDEDHPPNEHGYYFAPRHFIPLAYTSLRREDHELQLPCATISGYVLDTAIITNPETGIDFSWARVQSTFGEVDVVCAPCDLTGYLVTGGIATLNCYLIGRVLADTSN